tara:strand:+ start:382 stop:768 length:387 start_codon:yes stop_codon:yes gene_type:complete
MKFLGGFITGVISTILFLAMIYFVSEFENQDLASDDILPGLVTFPEKADCLTKQNLKVFQTIKPNVALVEFGTFPNETMALIINYSGKSYYDDEKINIPSGMCAKQFGTYKYETRMGIKKTVPAVSIE